MLADVAVVGGGPAGSVAALLLGRAGLSVVVLDGAPPQAIRWGETSPPRLRDLLVEIGLWREFLDFDPPRVRGIAAAWGRRDVVHTDYLSQTPGNGWQIPRGPFDRWLLGRASLEGATVFHGREVRSLRRETRCWGIDVGVGVNLEATWLIDAAGRFPRFRGAVPRIPLDRLVVLRASAYGDPEFSRDRPLVEASPSGWWFSVGGPRGMLSFFYFSDADLIPAGYRSPSAWSLLRSHAPATLERLERTGARFVAPRIAPARSQHARLPLPAGVLPVGDAALAFDPLSGQGTCFAIESAIVAARTLLEHGADWSGAASTYGHWLEDRIASYKSLSSAVYREETRWPQERFWARRREGSPATSTRIPSRAGDVVVA